VCGYTVELPNTANLGTGENHNCLFPNAVLYFGSRNAGIEGLEAVNRGAVLGGSSVIV